MKFHLLLPACLAGCMAAHAQQPESQPYITETQLEAASARTEANIQDDGQWQEQEALRRRPLSLNKASAADLSIPGVLTPVQIASLIRYRDTLGAFISIYELQAVPGFDTATIMRLLPFVQTGAGLDPEPTWKERFSRGDTRLMARYGRTLEAARGYQHTDSAAPHYLGSPDGLQLRYRYNYPGYASYGIVMQKDAGEQWFRGQEKKGFDFYSIHAAIRNKGALATLMLGDYTVNMGQGLVNWQAQAFGKSAGVMNMERQGELLRPYASAGEIYFYRGAAITLRAGNWRYTGFASARRLDATAVPDTLDGSYISALGASGYHRSETELAQRGRVQQHTAGGNISLYYHRWQWDMNLLYQHLSQPLQKTYHPYNQFEFSGQALGNASIDYSGNWHNLHFFGETAMSSNHHLALLHGLMAAVAPAIDLALVYRHYDKAYQSLYANAIGESFRPANESGFYSAITWKILTPLTLNAYFDSFRFPWLKYRVDAPSGGHDVQANASYTLSRKSSLYMGYHNKVHGMNAATGNNGIHEVLPVTESGWRCQALIAINRAWMWKMRVQTSAYKQNTGTARGWMCYEELVRQWQRFACTGRFTLFHTNDDEARLYINETSMLYSYDIAQLYGTGCSWYVQARYKTRHVTVWCRLRQGYYRDADHTGSGWDEIGGARKTAVQLQAEYHW